MAQITPLENGLHSLARALEAFHQFHEDSRDVFAMKDAILRAHHGLETIAKFVLFEINPVFLLRKDAKVGQYLQSFEEYVNGFNSFILDDSYTIGLPEALSRLQAVGATEQFPPREFTQLREAVDNLQEFRNALQHFAIRANVETVARVLGNCVPRFVDLLEVLAHSPARYAGYGYGVLWRAGRAELTGYRDKLKELYPKADAVLDLMRARYDNLIAQTREYFSARTFSNMQLTVEIRDHGNVGAPPYYPRIKLSGLLNVELDPHGEFRYVAAETDRATHPLRDYEGSLTLTQPQRDGAAAPTGIESVIRGEIQVEAAARFRTLEGVLSLPGGDEYIPLLRDAELRVSVQVTYRGRGTFRSPHFSVDNLLEVSGNLSVDLTALPSGYARDDPKHLIAARFEAPLNESNAPFRLHSFLNQAGKLQSNRLVDWTIETRGDLQFSRHVGE